MAIMPSGLMFGVSRKASTVYRLFSLSAKAPAAVEGPGIDQRVILNHVEPLRHKDTQVSRPSVT